MGCGSAGVLDIKTDEYVTDNVNQQKVSLQKIMINGVPFYPDITKQLVWYLI